MLTIRDRPEDEPATVAAMRLPAWMVAALACNPDYCSWGPGEDDLTEEVKWASWKDFNGPDDDVSVSPFRLPNKLNEYVNFHFEASCASEKCVACDGGRECSKCQGCEEVRKGPVLLSLILWVLLPRKGRSIGVEVSNLAGTDMPHVYAFLRRCEQRNVERFSRVPRGA